MAAHHGITKDESPGLVMVATEQAGPIDTGSAMLGANVEQLDHGRRESTFLCHAPGIGGVTNDQNIPLGMLHI
ncbi:MAG: hypothetical protein VR75_14790 [Hyphomonadaceae bacterium BRH_c29]|nr:MAG: hypothetical protein VR75_14790 [Hyphomonadaceae bacterium BRH_c29]